ncbi:MAG: L-serine ammonia-lyase [Myxococcota bacterium]
MSFVSVFDLFKVGIGPSSSHTVGPMRAAVAFRNSLERRGLSPDRVRVTLFGSLAHTGRGHHTDRAVLWGMAGLTPDRFDAAEAARISRRARSEGLVDLPSGSARFRPDEDLVFDTEREVRIHPNELRLEALLDGVPLLDETWLSVGGGFIARPTSESIQGGPAVEVPHAFDSAGSLLAAAERAGLSICELIRANELAFHSADTLQDRLHGIWSVMEDCMRRGVRAEGVLPGGLAVQRRAAALHRRLESEERRMKGKPMPTHMDWVHVWAMAVNEENAAGGQVVTAPTNGAAGIVPAVLQYYLRFIDDDDEPRPEVLAKYFLTASAIGGLFKRNASISGAEVGCQGEVGTAASMAAAGLCALLGGTNPQIEHAAEIAIEHNLGLTCDPVGGLVQVPCIERNGFGASKAISAARLAMHEDGDHRVTLDSAIETMRRTGADMSSKYKETSLGGLAVSVIEC